MKKLFFPLLVNCFFLLPKITFSQIPLDYDEIGIKFTPKKEIDTIEFSTLKFNKKFKCKIYLKSILGACDFKIYDEKGKLFLEGHYSNSLDTLSKYRLSQRRGSPPSEKIIYGVNLYKYFYPLKIDNWIYYDKKGKISEQYYYEYTRIE